MAEEYPEDERHQTYEERHQGEFVYAADKAPQIGIAEEHLNKVICKYNTYNCGYSYCWYDYRPYLF